MNYFTEISFPAIDFVWNPSSSFFIGPLQIHWYGVLIAVGMMLAVLYACGRSREFGLHEDDLIDGVLCVVPFAVLCARLYYCIFQWDIYADDPLSILYIWEGGLAIYGGVIGAAIGIAVFAKIKKSKVNLLAVLDITSLGFLIGQSIGRWGNFLNREAFGAPTESIFRMGLLNSVTGIVEYYHPTFLYESVWNLVGFLLLHFLSKKRKFDGQVALGYVAWYGLGRTFIEGLRMDSLYWGPVRVSQLLAAVSCFAAVVVLIVAMMRKPDPAKLFVNVKAAQQATEEETQETEEQEESANG
ncbi:MAG: prolipoprotein diacylglyceryl transferase [Oscillospiraceae bacterium]|nr:prolipoprotein diacylglyceryl transferase [Oscillospiraceae bacterium]